MTTPIAKTNFRGQERGFGIKPDDRRRHMYVIGKTGMGKTVLLQNMTIADIEAGCGLAVVDPHGEYAEELLDYIPPNRINDVIYFNPADLDFPIAFNAIEKVAPENRHLVASGLMGVFKKIWPDVWSARMEYILNNTILALLEYPNSTLLGIMRMLANKDYRRKVIDKVTDPVIKSFWLEEYAQYNERFEKEAIAPIQNKVGQFIAAPIIRNIIGQTKSSIDMREAMDSGKILIINLSKGKIGEDNSKLLGGMLVTKLQLAAMSRVDIPEHERRDFYLYVDEFQNFATDSFADILSEARKYRLDLIMAHQYIAQLPEKVRDAVFGNIGTMMSFRVGAEDAEFLEKEFMPDFTANDLVNLAKTNIYLKLMIDGVASRPFSATTFPPRPRPSKSNKEAIIRVSRERYSRSRKEVEEKISRWTSFGGTAAKSNTYDTVSRPNPKKYPPQERSGLIPPGKSRKAEEDNGADKGFHRPKIQSFYKPFRDKEFSDKEKKDVGKTSFAGGNQRPDKNFFPSKRFEAGTQANKGTMDKDTVRGEDKNITNRQEDARFFSGGDARGTNRSSRERGGAEKDGPNHSPDQRNIPTNNQNNKDDNARPLSGNTQIHRDNEFRRLPREEKNDRQIRPPQSNRDDRQVRPMQTDVKSGQIRFPQADTGVEKIKTISLKQALTEKVTTSFGREPVKKEIDKENLKKLIEESLDDLEKEKAKARGNGGKPLPPVNFTPASGKSAETTGDHKKPNQFVLKPGEKIFFKNQKPNSNPKN